MNILTLGGSGFVGRTICAMLVAQGDTVTVLTRRREHAHALSSLPGVTIDEGVDLFAGDALTARLRGHDAVINLVGILHGDFQRSHVTLTERVIAACEGAGVRRYLHMSALGADAQGPSEYQRSKGRAEALVRGAGLDSTVFAPSVIFGRDDRFLNQFANMVALLPPWMPMLLPGGYASFQPVWVNDVARAFVCALREPASIGQRYELVGPARYTLAELVRYVVTLSGTRHAVVGLPRAATALAGALLQFAPGKPMTPDNVKSMSVDNVSSAPWPAFAGDRAALETVVPSWLGRAAAYDRLADVRRRARH
ncbi:MAG: complex I NDUFA9 subunit family protein [Burkholderiales bacterium]|nr:complex I NDUFA9 subunit family protein [Burkholderiales bacterium]